MTFLAIILVPIPLILAIATGYGVKARKDPFSVLVFLFSLLLCGLYINPFFLFQLPPWIQSYHSPDPYTLFRVILHFLATLLICIGLWKKIPRFYFIAGFIIIFLVFDYSMSLALGSYRGV